MAAAAAPPPPPPPPLPQHTPQRYLFKPTRGQTPAILSFHNTTFMTLFRLEQNTHACDLLLLHLHDLSIIITIIHTYIGVNGRRGRVVVKVVVAAWSVTMVTVFTPPTPPLEVVVLGVVGVVGGCVGGSGLSASSLKARTWSSSRRLSPASANSWPCRSTRRWWDAAASASAHPTRPIRY